MNTLKKAAKILVECGYAHKSGGGHDEIAGTEFYIYKKVKNKHQLFPVQWDCDTIEGRRQADELIDWLIINKTGKWNDSQVAYMTPCHTARLDRIKYCLENIEP